MSSLLTPGRSSRASRLSGHKALKSATSLCCVVRTRRCAGFLPIAFVARDLTECCSRAHPSQSEQPIRAGKLRPLAATTATRSDALPEMAPLPFVLLRRVAVDVALGRYPGAGFARVGPDRLELARRIEHEKAQLAVVCGLQMVP